MVGTIRVEIRKNVSGKSGKNPISLIYSISGIRKRYALNKLVFPEYWDARSQRANYIPQREAKKLLPHLSVNDLLTETEINDINNEIQSVSTRIEKIEDKFLANEKPFSSQMVIDELKAIDAVSPKTKKEEQTGLVFDFIDSYVNENEATREKGSLSVYKSVKNHLQAYQDTTGHKVTFEKIDYSFFQKFQTFLIQRIKVNKAGEVSPMLNNTTIAKALSTLKTFLGYARKHGIKVNDSYRDFTIKREKLEVIALTQEEFDSLLNEDLSANKRLEKVRDIFCFACATGLRYSDIAQLKREHIADNFIKLTIKKTKTELTIPLNSISASILEKYKDLTRPLPLISNQNLNYYIKELCKLIGIDQQIEIVRFFGKKREVKTYPKHDLIHFHTARKTFVTLSLEKGMSAEEVMTISGHEDYKSFARYVKVTENRKKVVMLKAWGAPEVKLKVV
uniref:tyrosine-type recombinase/integrase n=1 Tax=Gelidibacter sp. TaxID=2018083 RepID=UPI00404A8F7D